jgi:hypothetical protein
MVTGLNTFEARLGKSNKINAAAIGKKIKTDNQLFILYL